MKIAIFSDCYLDLTGGITSSINAQKQALEDLGHTVYVFSSGYPRAKEELQKLASRNIFPVPSCKFLFRVIILESEHAEASVFRLICFIRKRGQYFLMLACGNRIHQELTPILG